MDYFDRDSQMAFGGSQASGNIMLRNVFVARGKCSDAKKCFKCKNRSESGNMHLMICYPYKLIPSAMNFFATRIKNHQAVVSRHIRIPLLDFAEQTLMF